MKENFAHVSVSLDIAGKPALFVLLSEDGSINRMGTGGPNNVDRDLFIGAGQAARFVEFMERVSEDIFPYQGQYEAQERSGADCSLTILFATRANETVGFKFRYGAESEGPPPEICDVVRAAVEVTDPWWRGQQAMVNKCKDGEPSAPRQQPASSAGGGEPKRSWRDLFRRRK